MNAVVGGLAKCQVEISTREIEVRVLIKGSCSWKIFLRQPAFININMIVLKRGEMIKNGNEQHSCFQHKSLVMHCTVDS